MIRDELIKRLLRLDEDADLIFTDGEELSLIIVGGGALVLMECLSRATHDIDALYASREIKGLLEKYDINCDVQTYINNFPYNYEDRLEALNIESRRIKFYTASLEDIVIAKLFSYRDKDKEDIESNSILNKLDWARLESLATNADEVKTNALNESNYLDFKYNYDEYVRGFRPCAN